MNILLVSDTHLSARATAFAANWAVIRQALPQLRPDLIIHLGDITVNGAEVSSELAEAQPMFAGIDCPIHFLPGNHDIGDNPQGAGGGPADACNSQRLRAYRDVFGADRWSINCEGWQLIGLNAQLFGTASEEEEQQFKWLEAVLREHKGPLGILLHKPLFRDAADETEVHGRYVLPAPRERLLRLVAGRELRFVASGHVHQARQTRVGGCEHVWVPSTAFCLPLALQERIGEKRVGFSLLRLENNDHSFQTLSFDGLITHNLFDHADVYPGLAAAKHAASGTGTAL